MYSGTQKIFEELRNMPCPHLECDNDDPEEIDAAGCIKCSLGRTCDPGKPETCPVIEALLVYIPWKRDMLEEEEDYNEYMYNNAQNVLKRSGTRPKCMWDDDDEDLVDNYGFYKPRHDKIDPDGDIYTMGVVKIGQIRLVPGNYYIVKRENHSDDYIGSFYNMKNGEILRFTEDDSFFVEIDIKTIDSIEYISFKEVQEYYAKDICGIDMEKKRVYTVHFNNGQCFTGEFNIAMVDCIFMKANGEQEKIYIDDITGIELIE